MRIQPLSTYSAPFLTVVSALALPLTSSAQQPSPWRALESVSAVEQRTALDTYRNRALLADPSGSIWELDNETWGSVEFDGPRPSANPSGGTQTGNYDIAYDELRDKLVWYNANARELWEFDTAWEQVPIITTPEPRTDFAFAYDRKLNRVVLHGGLSPVVAGPQTIYSDTWVWDGAVWVQTPDSGPPRFQHQLAFDPVTSSMMFVGGLNSTSESAFILNEAWLLSDTGWTAATAPNLQATALVLDERRQRLRAVGILGSMGPAGVVKEWNGSSWTSINTTGSAIGIRGSSVYDIREQSLVSVGGRGGYERLRNSMWKRIGSIPFLTLAGHPAAFDRARNEVVVPLSVSETVTWAYSNQNWTRNVDSGLPSRSSYQLNYIDHQSRSVFFGGSVGLFGQPSAETWGYDGSTWTLLDTDSGPSARAHHAAAYDRHRSELILFGGILADGTASDETWTWDGSQWTQRFPAASPPARNRHTMAFDSSRGRILMFGGLSPATDLDPLVLLDDTWEWDGTDWVDVSTSPSPPATLSPSLAYDENRKVMVLGTRASEDIWEWDTQAWSVAAPPVVDELPLSTGLVYSPETRTVLAITSDVQSLEITDLTKGCAAASAPDTATLNIDSARPATGDRVDVELANLPTSGTLFNLIGFERLQATIPLNTLGISGCNLAIQDPLVASMITLDLVTADGSFGWTLQIPDLPSAMGVSVLLQSLAIDSATNNAASLTTGRSFTVVAPAPSPLILGHATPDSAQPGDLVHLSGSGFAPGAVVELDGEPVPTTFVDSGHLTFAFPTSPRCDIAMAVSNPDGRRALSAFHRTPRVLDAEFPEGPSAGGAFYVLKIRGMTPDVDVTIGGAPAVVMDVSDTAVLLSTPPGSPGEAEVVITTPSGCVGTTTYTYL